MELILQYPRLRLGCSTDRVQTLRCLCLASRFTGDPKRLVPEGPMFYSTEILGRRSPLGAIWCADCRCIYLFIARDLAHCGMSITAGSSVCMQDCSSWQEAASLENFECEHCRDMVRRSNHLSAWQIAESITPWLKCSSVHACSKKIMEPDIPHSLRLQGILIGAHQF